MSPDELRALADALDKITPVMGLEELHHMETLDRAADYLRACADAQPVGWMHPDGRVVPTATMDQAYRDGGAMQSSLRDYTIPLYAAPVPPQEDRNVWKQIIPEDAPQAEPKRDVWEPDELEQIIDNYVADYELNDGEVFRDPTDEDRFMIKDAIMGLLADPTWDQVWGALIDTQVLKKAEPKREPNEKQIADACLRYRHDFGLLDKYERDCIVNEAWRWADAFGIGGSDAE